MWQRLIHMRRDKTKIMSEELVLWPCIVVREVFASMGDKILTFEA